jgi:Bacterial antitoxin of type II TA system, VapB
MVINLALDSDLVERALEVSGERTKEAAIALALREFIARREQGRLIELFGKLEWDMSFDWKAERERR